MYYRRKVLLALIESFGGNLKRTDCEELLFKFCQISGKNHYEFFPYQYGPFSFVSYFDKRRLTDQGFLKHGDDFQLNTDHSFMSELKDSDRKALLVLKRNVGSLSGNQLIKKIYREHPQFAAKSKIINELFTPEEVNQLQFAWNKDTSSIIFTIGYEGITIDGFLNKLITNNIDAVIDVRQNPHSMKYGFSKKRFKDHIEKAGMIYTHIPELGIPSSMRKGLGTTVSHDDLFRVYETELLPKQKESQEQLLTLIDKYPRISLVCFEADYKCCHRNTLINHLQKNNTLLSPVFHL